MADVPRIESIRVKNYRTLHDLTLDNLTPLTVLLGPNGSGKSTLMDVFAFLSECFGEGLRSAWRKRGRFAELRSRGQNGPIEFEIKYREAQAPHEDRQPPKITYYLAIDEDPSGGNPFVAQERLEWRRASRGKPFRFLDFTNGQGSVVSGEVPEKEEERSLESLVSNESLAVNTLGQLSKHPRVASLRQFILGWYLSYISADSTKLVTDAGPQEHLSITGDNLPNVVQYLYEQHPDRLADVLQRLATRIPQLESVTIEPTRDGRLVLLLKDIPFQEPVLSRFASDGTMKLLAYLTVLYNPYPPTFIGIEEPENHLHPFLLSQLAEECRTASATSQIFITTHSPFLVDGLKPKELWILDRDENGFTTAQRASEVENVEQLVEHGALLGNLWTERYFNMSYQGGTASGKP